MYRDTIAIVPGPPRVLMAHEGRNIVITGLAL